MYNKNLIIVNLCRVNLTEEQREILEKIRKFMKEK